MAARSSRTPTPFTERFHLVTVSVLERFILLSLGLFIGLGLFFLPATLRLLWSALLQPLA